MHCAPLTWGVQIKPVLQSMLLIATQVSIPCKGFLREHHARQCCWWYGKDIVANNLVCLQEELVFTQQRVESKKKEAETEKHLKQLNKRETGRLMVCQKGQ